jgi:hypothetical protein
VAIVAKRLDCRQNMELLRIGGAVAMKQQVGMLGINMIPRSKKVGKRQILLKEKA